jgi:DNA-binding NarL/FixJ family response regulator
MELRLVPDAGPIPSKSTAEKLARLSKIRYCKMRKKVVDQFGTTRFICEPVCTPPCGQESVRHRSSIEPKRSAVLLDPHPLWLEALQPVLTSLNVEVVGKAFVVEWALSLIETHKPDIFLVDTSMQGTTRGPDLVRAARQLVPSLHVIALCSSSNPADIDAAFEAGAVAYVVKTARAEDVAATIRQVFHHSIFFAPVRVEGPGHAPADVTAPAPVRIKGTLPARHAKRAPAEEEGAPLTRREREILALVAEGYSNRELAKILWVTEQTVKFHLSNIYRKVGASNRTEASRWAHAHQIVKTGESTP